MGLGGVLKAILRSKVKIDLCDRAADAGNRGRERETRGTVTVRRNFTAEALGGAVRRPAEGTEGDPFGGGSRPDQGKAPDRSPFLITR
jgi:hypothetical protein